MKCKTISHPGKKTLVLLFLLVLSSMIIYADDVVDIINRIEIELCKVEKTKPDDNPDKCHECLQKIEGFTTFLKGIINEDNRLNFFVAGGFSGDEAFQGKLFSQEEVDDKILSPQKSGEKLSKLEIDSGVFKGIYPRSFEFDIGTVIQFKNSGLLEEVTTLKLNYNHYFGSWVKAYVFAERFSDSYLSLSHRYEVGAGIKVEADIGLANRADTKYNEYEKNKKDVEDFYEDMKSKEMKTKETHKRCRKSGENPHLPPCEAAARSILLKLLPDLIDKRDGKKDIERIERAFKKQYSFLSLGMAVTILSEIEKSEIETSVHDINGNDKVKTVEDSVKFPLDAEQRYRLVLRPSLRIMPIDSVALKGYFYYKLPLGKPVWKDGVYDYRYHLQVRAQYDMKSVTWAKKIAVVFEYDRQYDNTPPRILPSTVEKYLSDYTKVNTPEGVFKLGRDRANRVHSRFQWKLEIKF